MKLLRLTMIVVCLCWSISALTAQDKSQPDKEVVQKLIKQLGADKYKERTAAKEELINLGRRIVPDLHAAFEKTDDPEVRSSLKTIIGKLQDLKSLLAGNWEGTWTSQSSPGYLFSFVLELKVEKDNEVKGQFKWQLLQSPHESEQDKVGQTAIEYVKGSGDAKTRTVSISGYNKDDPKHIISLDQYKVTWNKLGTHFSGKTCSHGSWLGVLKQASAKKEKD